MSEVKNNFIKSKMNKDLDARLIPNGEYRNAVNAQISRSEGEGVGTLENVLGNELISTIEPGVANLMSIGHFVDEVNNFIYVFLTDNYGSIYTPTGAGSNHFIYRFNASASPQVSEKLVEGAFLNFSTQSPIYGINLLENLLFFTDNRNQPRKINITNAVNDTTYYTTEDQISVAKYNPYSAINLYELSTESPSVADVYQSTMKDVVSKFLPTGSSAIVQSVTTPSTVFTLKSGLYPFYPNKPAIGQKVGVIRTSGAGNFLIEDTGSTVVSSTGATQVVITAPTLAPVANDELVFLPNPYYDPNYSGDSTFLEDKFARFSYRFKFEDNEYSLIAPFTQICFIPKQDGYFLTTSAETFPAPTGAQAINTDQDQAVNSSIVSFMENKVNSIGLNIPLPSAQTALLSDFKIDEIDILYKESDGLSIKVIDTILVSSLSSSNNYLNYLYTGKKPFKTLLEKEISRVYDKVPVKALAQEVSGNRVIYGNFQNRHTPPKAIDFNAAISDKTAFDLRDGSATTSSSTSSGKLINLSGAKGTIEIGSRVSFTGAPANLLVEAVGTPPSSPTTVEVDQDVTVGTGVAIAFSPSSNDKNTTSIIEYPSSSLKTNRSYQVGVILSDKFGRSSDVILTNNTSTITIGGNDFTGADIYSPYIDEITGEVVNEWPGNSIKVLFNTVIGPANPNSSTLEPGLYNGDVSSVNYNPLGWYSYKIVVQQTEQEYYNVYAPGAIKGRLDGVPSSEDSISRIVIINDNINKIPRDLSEVGPSDKIYRSSVQLFGRVVNNFDQYLPVPSFSPTVSPVTSRSNVGNQQYYPDQRTFTVNSIQNLFDEFDWPDSGFTGTPPVISPLDNTQPLFSYYSAESNPFVAEFSTSQLNDPNYQFGVNNLNPLIYSGINFVPVEQLCVFETEPVVSLLDIYYETSTSGLVNDLNTAILNELNVSNNLNNFNPNLFTEGLTLANIMSSNFNIVNQFGVALTIGTGTGQYQSLTLTSATDRQDPPQDVSSYFTLVQPAGAGVNQYNILLTADFTANAYVGGNTGAHQFDLELTATMANGELVVYNEPLVLGNVQPQFYIRANQPPVPADVAPSTITLNSTSGSVNPYNDLTPSLINILTLYGRNGAYDATGSSSTASPNTRNDLEWNIDSVTNSNGDDVTENGIFALDVTPEVPGNSFVQQCNLRNAKQPPQNIKLDTYTVKIRLTDAAGQADAESRVVNVVLQYGVFATQIQTSDYELGGFPQGQFVEIQFSNLSGPDAGLNGWYIYTGTWQELTSSIINNTIVIQNATTTGDPCPLNTQFSSWYWGGNSASQVSLAAARQKIADCLVSPGASYGAFNPNTNLSPDPAGYGFDVSN